MYTNTSFARPLALPPGTPKDRVLTLRKAFQDTLKDPAFLAETEKSQLEITPVPGEEVEKLVKDLYQTPKAIAAKAAEFIRQ